MKSSIEVPTPTKRRRWRSLARLALLVVLGGLICGGILLSRSPAVQTFLAQRKIDGVISDYADKVVLHTQSLIVARLEEFSRAASALRAQPSDHAMAAATAAWLKAREQWHPAKAFAFGPNAFYDFDKRIASWPIDRPMIEHSLSRMAAGELQLDSGFLRRKINSTQRGFYAAEYLLFREGKPRRAADLRPAELLYLDAVAKAMLEEALDFQASWVGSANMPRDAAARLRAADLPDRPSYAEEFTHPGDRKRSRYFSRSVVLQEMFQENLSVLEDTCPVIEEWLGSGDPKDSESQDSRNAVADIINLLQGVENAYLGGVTGSRDRAMADLVAAKDAVMDRRIRIALADARYRVAAIGNPYGEPAADRELKLKIATASCWKLASKLSTVIPQICLDPAAEPWAAYVP